MSGGLHVEGAASPRWRSTWQATGREPFAHPEYGLLFAGSADTCVAACWEDDGGQVLLPLVLRDLPPAVVERSDVIGWLDGTSPYGYGGPFVRGAPDIDAFYAALLAWMRDSRVLTCFVRGSVVGSVSPTAELDGLRLVHLADNVVVGLDASPEERWRRYEHKVRKNVNKARRHGLTTTVSSELTDAKAFTELYGDTMARRSAAEFYRFDEVFFERLVTSLAGSYWIASTCDEDGVMVSTELVLTGERHCYSFLGGTRQEAFAMSPNDLLKHDVIDHAADAGLDSYVLGGGYAPGDGIYRYKRAFDPTGVVPFRAGQLVADLGLYESVCSGVSQDVGSRFFPAYRAT